MTNDTAGSNLTPNHYGVRIWDLYTVKWEDDNSLWEDAAIQFNSADGLDTGLSVNTIYNANPVSLTVNARLTDKHFQLDSIDYGSDAALKVHTISAEKHSLKGSAGSAYPGLPNLNISDNIMYWKYAGQPIVGGSIIWTTVLNGLLGTTIGIEDFVLIKSSDGTSASGSTGNWVGDLTSITQGEFYEVHVSPGVSINLAALGKRFYSNDYMQLANDNIATSASQPNNVSVSDMGRASTAMNTYDDYFQRDFMVK